MWSGSFSSVVSWTTARDRKDNKLAVDFKKTIRHIFAVHSVTSNMTIEIGGQFDSSTSISHLLKKTVKDDFS